MEVNQKQNIVLGMADLKTARAPAVINTNLGSCIAVCLYCESKKTGGMIHFMISQAGPAAFKENFKKAKYADTGIPELIKEIKTKFGIKESELKAKIFGGAKILQGITNNIGGDNEAKAREILKKTGIPILASKTGGEKGYKIAFDLDTGKVTCQIFGSKIEEF